MFPATSLPRFGVRRLDGALDIGVRTQKSNFEKQIQSGVEAAALQNGTPGRTFNPQPRRTTTPARLPRRGPRFRSVALFHLSYRSGTIADCEIRIADLKTHA